MTPDSHEQLAAAFESVRRLDEQARALALLAIETGLRERVLRLLEADAVATGVLETGVLPGPVERVPEIDPTWIGGFRILRRLGQGSMGVVFEAEERHPHRRVALKVLHPWMRTELALELFRFEAQALGQVQHAGIPAVYVAGESEGIAYLAMELVEGTPLWAWALKADIPARVEMLRRIALTVEAAHQAGLVHRDLKPSNILVTPSGDPKLLDFGVASPLSGTQGMVAGTPAYMSPEQARGEPVGPTADVFALGIVGYELLTGERPTRGVQVRDLAQGTLPVHVPANRVEPAIGPDVALILERAVYPAARYRQASAGRFAADLERTQQFLPLEEHGPYRRTQLWARRHRAHFALGALTWALICGVAAARQVGNAWNTAAAENRAGLLIRSLTPGLEAAAERQDWEGLERQFQVLVRDPTLAETSNLTTAWIAQAHRLERYGRPGAPLALTEAYLRARTPADVQRVQTALAQRFAATARWHPLWLLQGGLDAEHREQLASEIEQAAVALRHFDALPPTPMLQALARATSLPWQGDAVVRLDVQDDGVMDSLVVRVSHLTFYDGATGAETIVPGSLPGLKGCRVLVRDGRLWFAVGTGEEPASLRSWAPGDADYTQHATLPRGRVSHLVEFDGDFVIGTTYPERGIHRVDATTGQVRPLDPATQALDSDVLTMEVADLDGDGAAELIIGLGSWTAYQVRVFQAAGQDVRLLQRVPLGNAGDLVAVTGPDDEPRIVIGKMDVEPDARHFGEATPYGPPAGLYTFQLGSEALEYTPIPLYDNPATGPDRLLANALQGDFDGDGTVDLAWNLEHFDIDAVPYVWILADFFGEKRSYTIRGLSISQAIDHDGDGDAELLAADTDGRLWVLGAGEEHLPTLGKTSAATELAPLPHGATALVRQNWDRASQLIALGLVEEATQALGSVCGLATEAAVRAVCHAETARFRRGLGDFDGAARHYAIALEAVDDDEIRNALVDTRLDMLDFVGAKAAVRDPNAWLSRAEVTSIDWLQDGILPGWTVHRDAVLTGSREGPALSVLNDHGVVLSRPVHTDGGVVAFDLGLHLETLELGAGLAVALEDADGRTVLLAGVWGQGGGGLVKAYQQCGTELLESLGAKVFVPPGQLRLRAASIPTQGALRCSNDLDGTGRWVSYTREPVPAGDYTLVLRAMGDPGYEPPTRMDAIVTTFSTTGLIPVEHEPTAFQRARRDLVEGRYPRAAATDPVALALLESDPEALRSALSAVWKRGDEAALRWWIRLRGPEVTPALEQVLGPAFSRIYHATLVVAAEQESMSAITREALLRPALASLDLGTPEGSQLALWRSSVWIDEGRTTEARRLLQLVLDGTGATADQRELAARLLE